MQFPIGLYQRSERVVAISAVGQRAKAVEPCHLSCGTDLEHHAAAGAVPIVTVGTTILGGSVEVSVNALNESHTPGKFAIHPLKLARVVKVCALATIWSRRKAEMQRKVSCRYQISSPGILFVVRGCETGLAARGTTQYTVRPDYRLPQKTVKVLLRSWQTRGYSCPRLHL